MNEVPLTPDEDLPTLNEVNFNRCKLSEFSKRRSIESYRDTIGAWTGSFI